MLNKMTVAHWTFVCFWLLQPWNLISACLLRNPNKRGCNQLHQMHSELIRANALVWYLYLNTVLCYIKKNSHHFITSRTLYIFCNYSTLVFCFTLSAPFQHSKRAFPSILCSYNAANVNSRFHVAQCQYITYSKCTMLYCQFRLNSINLQLR